MSDKIEFGVVTYFNSQAKRGRLSIFEDGQYTGEQIYFHLRDARKLHLDMEADLLHFTDERVHPVHQATLRTPDAVIVFIRTPQGDKAKPWTYGEDYELCLQGLTDEQIDGLSEASGP